MLKSSFTTAERQILVDVLEVLRRLTPENVWTTASDVTSGHQSPTAGLQHGSLYWLTNERGATEASSQGGTTLGAGWAQDWRGVIVSMTPIKAIMMTSMGEGRSRGSAADPSFYAATALEAAARGKL